MVSGERRQTTVRKFPFVVIYEVFDNTFDVSAVFHTSRNPNDKIRSGQQKMIRTSVQHISE